MGRVKLHISRIDDMPRRQVTFSKRSSGLLKKAYELSILCAADVGVIMFTPSGKSTVFCSTGEIEHLITRFAKASPYDRPKRSPEQLEKFQKAVRTLNSQREQLEEVLRTQPAFGDGEGLKLQDMLDRAIMERRFWEEKAKLFQGKQSPQNVDSLTQLFAVEFVLKQGLVKLRQRMQELATSAPLASDHESPQENSLAGRPRNTLEPHPQAMEMLEPTEGSNFILMDEQFKSTGTRIDGGNDYDIRWTCDIHQQVGPHVQDYVVDPIFPTSTTSKCGSSLYYLDYV